MATEKNNKEISYTIKVEDRLTSQLERLVELINHSPDVGLRFIDRFNDLSKLVLVHSDSHITGRTGEGRVIIEPSDSFLYFMATCAS